MINFGSGRNPTSFIIKNMRKILVILAFAVSVLANGQGITPKRAKQECRKIELKDGVDVHRVGTEYTRNTYTEIYEILTDSIVYRFGLVYSKDSTFIKREQRDGIIRKLYDQMKRIDAYVERNQEQRRKETEEFMDSYRASYEVWSYFRLLGVLKW